jgi:phosphorylcholine metabolism protein LicD
MKEVKLPYRQEVVKYNVTSSNYNNFCFPKEYLLGIYDIVKYTKELCDREGIEYFIDGGTMLGCIRDGGQILYDNDADFGITPTNFKKLLPFKDEFEKQNYDFIVSDSKIQIINKNLWIVQESKHDKVEMRNYAGLDILVYKSIKRNNITEFVIQNDQFRTEYPFACHYKIHLYPLKDYIYRCLDAEPLILKGANNPKRYLDGTYPNWETKKIYDHKTYVIIE